MVLFKICVDCGLWTADCGDHPELLSCEKIETQIRMEFERNMFLFIEFL